MARRKGSSSPTLITPSTHLPVHVTFVALPHLCDEELSPAHLRDWRRTLGQIRHANLNFAHIICGSRTTELALAEIAAKVFPTAQIHARWVHIGNLVTRRAGKNMMGDITSFLEHSPPGRKSALVLEYDNGILIPGVGLLDKTARPGDYATYRAVNGAVQKAQLVCQAEPADAKRKAS